MPANEHLCMRLAARFKLPVPDTRLLRIPDPLFCVARFDRKKSADGSVERLHQIDLCQVLNLPVEMKYQQSYTFSPQGATYADLFKAAASTAAPAASELGMIRWVVFNYLIGNTDAHAKNISFYLDHEGLRLAPFYDLVCGTAYGAKDLALFIGDEEDIRFVNSLDWLEMCKKCGINPQLIAAELKAQAQQWRKWRDALVGAADYADGERLFLRKMAEDIDARAERMLTQATEIRPAIRPATPA
ncbi:MAG: HipA domain-containing protein [Noviherbaspirillum sp.]